MKLMRTSAIATLVILLAGLSVVAAQTPAPNKSNRKRDRVGIPAVNQYLEYVRDQNYEMAAEMWTPEALERASRFGITFTGIPLKVDCSSPIVRNLDSDRQILQTTVNSYEDLPCEDWSKLRYSQIVYGQEGDYYYFAQARGDWAWLGYAQDCYAADWDTIETRYLRIHVHPDVKVYLNELTLAETDRFVASMCKKLDMPKELEETIQEKKIEYFYCPSDTVVQDITGHLVKGTTDLASNDIISAVFPHFHEMVHLLVNIRLQTLPLYTLPIIREGSAVMWGGRWGKHQSALTDLAVFLYREQLVELDSILTMQGFSGQAGADIIYPVAGLLSAYFEDALGTEGYLKLYLALSGSFEKLSKMQLSDIQAEMLKATGLATWPDFRADFEAYLNRYMAETRGALPGLAEKRKDVFTYDRVKVGFDKEWMSYEFNGEGDSVVQGNLLFSPDERLVGQTSSLRAEQYGSGFMADGYRYGVRVDQNEAGLYDYATNQLVAKYIWGITPSDKYFDAENKRVCIRFRRSFVEKHVPKDGKVKLLAY